MQDLIKIKNFFLQKTLLTEFKKTSYRLGEIICKLDIQQRTVSRIYKEPSKISKKENKHNFKMIRELNRYFTKKDIRMANKQ